MRDLAGYYGLGAANVALVEGLTRWLARSGYARQTIRSRREGAARWCAWLEGRGVAQVAEARGVDVADYGRYLHACVSAETGRGLAAGTIGGRLAAVRLLDRYRVEVLGAEPAVEGLPRIDADEGPGRPRHLSRAQVAALYAACDVYEAASRSTWPTDVTGAFARTVLALAYGCGLRAGEVVALRVGDVDVRGGRLLVAAAKNGRGRYVPLSAGVARDLGSWLGAGDDGDGSGGGERARFVRARCDRVLTTVKGTPLSYLSLLQRWWRLCRAAGVARCGLHTLRHSIATHLLQGDGDGAGGMDLEAIGLFLGHRTLAATQVYAAVVTGGVALGEIAGPETGAP